MGGGHVTNMRKARARSQGKQGAAENKHTKVIPDSYDVPTSLKGRLKEMLNRSTRRSGGVKEPTSHQCNWPIDDPLTERFSYCGGKVARDENLGSR